MADAAGFRTSFPEFSSLSTFPDTQVNLWLVAAAARVSDSVWGDTADLGKYLLTAHLLSMWVQAKEQVSSGGLPTGAGGAVTSKSLGEASISFDTASSSWAGSGSYNQTTYGRQFVELQNIFGAGGLLV